MPTSQKQKRRSTNRNRRVQTGCKASQLKALAQKVSYTGHPSHKRDPGKYNLTPPALPHHDKTLCDEVGTLQQAEAERLLKDGIVRGYISKQTKGGFPRRVWSITEDGHILEARLENPAKGTYHGYPVLDDDPAKKTLARLFNKP